MADIKRYGFYDADKNGGPMTDREVIGTIRKVEKPSKDDPNKMNTSYVADFMLNAKDPKTIKAAEMNPEGGGNLNLRTYTYDDPNKEGEKKIGHNAFYDVSQIDLIKKAAGKNIAPKQDANGKKVPNVEVVALRANLVVSNRNGIVLATNQPMQASQLETFGKSGKKARESMTAQYEVMNDWRAKGREAKAAEVQNQVGDRQVEAPAAAAETSAEMEAGN